MVVMAAMARCHTRMVVAVAVLVVIRVMGMMVGTPEKADTEPVVRQFCSLTQLLAVAVPVPIPGQTERHMAVAVAAAALMRPLLAHQEVASCGLSGVQDLLLQVVLVLLEQARNLSGHCGTAFRKQSGGNYAKKK